MIGTVIIGDTPVDVFGVVCPAEPSIGIMGDYVDIEDLQVSGVSIYEMVSDTPIFEKIQEAIDYQVGE